MMRGTNQARFTRRSLLWQGGAAVGGTLILAACGQSAPAASPAPTTASVATAGPTAAGQTSASSGGAPTKIRFIAMDYDDRMEPDTKQLIDAYNRSQGKVQADVQIVKWSEGKNVLLTQVNAGQPPDIANFSGGGLLEFVDAKVIEPLDERLGQDFLGNFVKASLDAMRVEGRLMGMPYFLDPRGMFYRTDLFDQAGLKPPETWDDVIQAAQKLHNPPTTFGIGLGVSGPSGRSDYWWYRWLGAIGAGSNLSRWGADKKSLVASDQGIAAVQNLVDLFSKLKVTQPNPVNAGRDEDLQPLFVSGKLAILETGSWFPTILQHNAPSIKFDVVPPPVAKAGMKHANAFWPDAVMMFAGSQAKAAATDLLKFMYSKENRLAFAKQRGVVPERTDVGTDPSYAVTKFDKFFFDQLQTAYNVFETPWPATGTADDVTIINGVAKAMLGEMPVQDAMQEAARIVDQSHGL